MNNIRNFINYFHLLPLLILILLGLYGIQALFHPGLYSAHDIWHQVARLYHYSAAVNDGAILPTWISTLANGYGYPLFYFSYHFPWLMGLPFIWLGFSIFSTLKILFGLAFMAAGFAMYCLAFVIFKNRLAALTAASLYLISPYHFFSIFVSASIGTVFQFALIPLIVLGLYQVIIQQKLHGIVLLSLSAAGSILSHLMTFVFISPFLAVYSLFLFAIQWKRAGILRSNRSLYYLIAAGCLTLGLSAFYLIPSLVYLPLVKASENNAAFSNIYLGAFITIKQLIYSTWGFAPYVSSAAESELSFQLGIAQWLSILGITFILPIYLLITFSNKHRPLLVSRSTFLTVVNEMMNTKFLAHRWLVSLFMLGLFVISCWLMLKSSIIIWHLISNYVALDFPFRYLVLAVSISSLLAGILVGSFKSTKIQLYLSIFLISVALYTNRNHVRVNMYTNYKLEDYVGAEITTNTYHEYLPLAADSSLLKLDKPPVIHGIPAKIIYQSPTRLVISTELDASRGAALRQYDFPGQQVYVNGNLVERAFEPGKLILLRLPPGHHLIEIIYKNPPIYNLSMLITVCSLVIIVYLLIRRKR